MEGCRAELGWYKEVLHFMRELLMIHLQTGSKGALCVQVTAFACGQVNLCD